MTLDILTSLAAAIVATVLEKHIGPVNGARAFYRGTLFQGRSMGILLVMLFGFIVALVTISRRMRLYNPEHITNFLHEQRLSVQACCTAGLILTGALYMAHAADIPRSIVLITLVLVTVSLSLRRLVYRTLLYRRFERGIGTRNVLIVGTGDEARALREHLQSTRHLGYAFKGFVAIDGSDAGNAETVGTLETIFLHARKHFVDEIIFATRCDAEIMHDTLEQARSFGIDLRIVPDLYGGLAWNSPIEYLGQFPTIPLHSGRVPEIGLILKRALDIAFAVPVLILLLPILIVIAIAVKLDSPGPIFYCSERIGKKGLVFRCLKFRTMVVDAEERRSGMMHLNERDGVLFKITNDPRITRVGRFLRKYSLDELPQFWNVLCGEMSIVGPRPPLASEVREYALNHMRRLHVMPGITGLWQVQSRRDPSFDRYVSLDLTYIENWSIWLDFKIMIRTFGVVLSGTGS